VSEGTPQAAAAPPDPGSREESIEAELRTSQERLRIALEAGRTAYWRMDVPGLAFESDGTLERLLGLEAGAFRTAADWMVVTHPDDEARIGAGWQACLDGTAPELDVEVRVRNGQGEWRWLSLRARVVRDAAGRPEAMAGTTRDVTDRKLVEDSLRASHELVRTALSTLQEAVLVVDPDSGLVVEANEPAERMFARRRDQLIGSDAPSLVGDDGAAAIRDARDPPADTPVPELEVVARRPGGGTFVASLRARPLGGGEDGRRRAVAVVRDLTEQRRSESERRRIELAMQQAQRLESLGVLAGGVAHEFNNLLTGVLATASEAEKHPAAAGDLARMLGEIRTAAQQASELTRQMLAYSGSAILASTRVSLVDLVREMVPLLERTVSKRCALALDLASAPDVLGDASQLRQVVMNLILNASEAIDRPAGEIRVRVSHRALGAGDVAGALAREPLAAGEYAVFEVEDTGAGMPPEVVARVFDPFFSTKAVGRGLGLAAVLGIVRAHGGGVLIASGQGKGTRVTVLLPAAGTTSSELPPAPATRPARFLRAGRVLVVDDEAAVRTAARRVLKRAGFEVVEAVDGVEAVATFTAGPGGFAAVLLDLTMPGMGGADVLARIRELRPEVPVVLSSGYARDAAMRQLAAEQTCDFVGKPYTADALLDTLERALRRAISGPG